MRRLRRFLFHFFTLISFLVCIAVIVFWIRSYDSFDFFHLRNNRYLTDDQIRMCDIELSSCRGAIVFELHRRYPVRNGREFGNFPPGTHWYAAGGENTMLLATPNTNLRARHHVDRNNAGSRAERWVLCLRHWMLIPPLIVMPLLWIIRFRRRRGAKNAGLCAVCGYDLRATPDRCPECGTTPNARPPKPEPPRPMFGESLEDRTHL